MSPGSGTVVTIFEKSCAYPHRIEEFLAASFCGEKFSAESTNEDATRTSRIVLRSK
jgi:hypothetical protein